MPNLRAAANQFTRGINPNVVAQVKRSFGYLTLPSGSRVPSYADVADVEVQPQALSFGDLTQLDGLNIQGTRRALYFNGALFGVVRVAQKGGDVLIFPSGTFPEGDVWLCVHVLEQWSQWGKVAITLQMDGANPASANSYDFSNSDNSQYIPGVG